jgi:hypothetical protein
MIMDSHRQNSFGKVLPHHIVIKMILDLYRFEYLRTQRCITIFIADSLKDNLITKFNAFVAYIYSRAGDQFGYILLAFATE